MKHSTTNSLRSNFEHWLLSILKQFPLPAFIQSWRQGGQVCKSSSRYYKLGFASLEERTVLSANPGMNGIDAFETVTNQAPANNLVQNGSFEIDTVATGKKWDTFSNLTHWEVEASGNIKAELQTNRLTHWTASEGDQWLELDGDETGPGVGWNNVSQGRKEQGLYSISQTINLGTETFYTLSFDFAARPGRSANDNQMSYQILAGDMILSGDQLTAHADQIVSKNSAPVWRTAKDAFVVPDGVESIQIRFNGEGPNNTFGMYLDNIVMLTGAQNPIIDIDTDSDNNGILDESSAEDAAEHRINPASVPGKRIFINIDDDNQNGIPDVEDGAAAYAANQTDNDLAEIRLKAPANLAAFNGHKLILGVEKGLAVYEDLKKTPLSAPKIHVDAKTARWYSWTIIDGQVANLPESLYIEGTEETPPADTTKANLTVFWRLQAPDQVNPDALVKASDTIEFSVEDIVVPDSNNAAGWQKKNTSDWSGIQLVHAWNINVSLEDIIKPEGTKREKIEFRTLYPEGSGGFAKSAQNPKPWEHDGTDSATKETYENGFDLSFKFAFDSGYVEADTNRSGASEPSQGDAHKMSFFANSGIKIFGTYEIAIFDTKSLFAATKFVPGDTDSIQQTIGKNGTYTHVETASQLMTGVKYGEPLTALNAPNQYTANAVGMDVLATMTKSANLINKVGDENTMRIKLTPNGQNYDVLVEVNDLVTFQDTNVEIPADNKNLVFQTHWDSGIKFWDINITTGGN